MWALASSLGALTVGSIGGCRRADEAASEGPPELSRLEPFSLQNQSGAQVNLGTFAGKVWAAAFMFTRCPTVCPEITRRMKRTQDLAKARGIALHLVSFSVDPEHDTPPVLAQFAAEYGADLKSWSFLTGEHEMIAKTAEQGFKVGLAGRADPNAEHMGITHGSHLVLVDRRGVIRGYYRTREDAELERLLTDAKLLLSA